MSVLSRISAGLGAWFPRRQPPAPPLGHVFFSLTPPAVSLLFHSLIHLWSGDSNVPAMPAPSASRRPTVTVCLPPPVAQVNNTAHGNNTTPRMIHLKTKEECRLSNQTVQVWTVELPSKHAEGILKHVKENVAGQDSIDLQHLRRFAKPRYLPRHVLGTPNKIKDLLAVSRAWEATPPAVMQAPATTAWEWSKMAPNSRQTTRPTTLHLLICPTQFVSLRDLRSLLMTATPFCSSADSWAYPLEIKEVTVPMLAPTSPEQADVWSSQYWPTFYRKTNPFGAHPGAISKAEEEMQKPVAGNHSIQDLLALAYDAARLTQSDGYGVGPGCVIVERHEGRAEIVSVAGDARKKPLSGGESTMEDDTDGCNGNVMGHAVMRAIGMIGRKRLRVASQPASNKAAKAERNFAQCGLAHDEKARDAFFVDLPVTPLERQFFERDNIQPDGYLCLRLEVVLTHEPCVMCSMALVHSRVGRVVFQHRMPQTGGLTAEGPGNDSGPAGLGYGLCWRKELNWQFMCWEYAPPYHARAGNVVHDAPPPWPRHVGAATAARPPRPTADMHSLASTHV